MWVFLRYIVFAFVDLHIQNRLIILISSFYDNALYNSLLCTIQIVFAMAVD